MQVFLAGTPVTVDAVFTDRHGNALEVASATYRVLGHAGEELQAETVLFGTGLVVTPPVTEPEPEPEVPTEVVPDPETTDPDTSEKEGGPATATYGLFGEELTTEEGTNAPAEPKSVAEKAPGTVTVPSELNVIAALDIDAIESDELEGVQIRELRTVEFKLELTGGNVIARKVVYALEPTDVLIAGLNSYQSYPEASLVAMNMPSLSGWEASDEQSRTAALVEARHRINRLNFRNASRGQSYLTEEITAGDISRLTPREFKSLSVRLRAALCRAQVAEADSLLGGDPEAERRRSGLVHETVGESAQTWRQTKALELPVSRKALGYLSGFISLTKQIGRAN